MKRYKTLWLCSREEYLEYHKEEPEENCRILGNLFLDNHNLSVGDIVNASGLSEKGQYDYAVPQDWFDEHFDEWKDDWTIRAVWFYPRDTKEEGHIFGRPIRLREIITMVEAEITREAVELWKGVDNEQG